MLIENHQKKIMIFLGKADPLLCLGLFKELSKHYRLSIIVHSEDYYPSTLQSYAVHFSSSKKIHDTFLNEIRQSDLIFFLDQQDPFCFDLLVEARRYQKPVLSGVDLFQDTTEPLDSPVDKMTSDLLQKHAMRKIQKKNFGGSPLWGEFPSQETRKKLNHKFKQYIQIAPDTELVLVDVHTLEQQLKENEFTDLLLDFYAAYQAEKMQFILLCKDVEYPIDALKYALVSKNLGHQVFLLHQNPVNYHLDLICSCTYFLSFPESKDPWSLHYQYQGLIPLEVEQGRLDLDRIDDQALSEKHQHLLKKAEANIELVLRVMEEHLNEHSKAPSISEEELEQERLVSTARQNMQQGDLKTAFELLYDFVQKPEVGEDSKYSSYIMLGHLGLRLDCLEDAMAFFRAALKSQPKSTEPLLGFALLEQQKGDFHQSIHWFLRAYSMSADLLFLANFIQACHQHPSTHEAIHALESFKQLVIDPPANIHNALAQLHLKNGDMEAFQRVNRNQVS